MRIPILILLFSTLAISQTVQPIQTTYGGGTCTFGQDVVSGNMIVVFANNEGALTTPTDTRVTTWTFVDSGTGTQSNTFGWIGILTSGGPETITLHGSLAFTACIIAEFPGSYGWTVDSHTSGVTPATGSFTTSAITTTKDGDLILGYASSDVYVAVNYLDGHANLDNGGGGYYIAGNAGSYSMTFNGTLANALGSYVLMALKPSTLTIVTSTVPSGAVGSSYTYAVRAIGGVGAYTWSVSSGSLPTGLSINSSTGVISGTPTGGTTTPTIQVTDGTLTATFSPTITINSGVSTPVVVNSLCSSVPTFTATAGNLIFFVQDNLGPFNPPTDTIGTPYKLLGVWANPVFQFTTMLKIGIYSGIAPVTNAANIINAPGCVVQFRNTQNFWDSLLFSTGNSASTASISGPNITTQAPNSMIWAGVDASTTFTTFTATAPFTLDINGSGTPVAGEHNLESTVGSYTPAFTQNGNSDGRWIIGALALRPTTSGVAFTSAYNWSDVF